MQELMNVIAGFAGCFCAGAVFLVALGIAHFCVFPPKIRGRK